MAEHTPTPWTELTYPNSTNVEIAAVSLPTIGLVRMGWGGGVHGSVTKEEAIANMAFIVKVVNMHQELVDIVTRLADGERSEPGHSALRDAAIELLSKVE